MSIVHENWVGLHPPKTGGHAWRQAARDTFGAKVHAVQPYHGMPYDKTVFMGRRVWMFVRHPALWLRSLWGDRVKSQWQEPHASSALWNDICLLVDEYKSDSFDTFAYSLINDYPGIVGWTFKHFEHPRLEVGYTERMHYDIGRLAPGIREVPLKNIGRYHPKIGQGLWDDIVASEQGYCDRFNIVKVYKEINAYETQRSGETS